MTDRTPQTPSAQREYFGKPQRDLPSDWIAIKNAVAARDGWVCAYCGDLAGPFEIDHIIPYSRAGDSTPDNLCVACKPCNRSKGARTPENGAHEPADQHAAHPPF